MPLNFWEDHYSVTKDLLGRTITGVVDSFTDLPTDKPLTTEDLDEADSTTPVVPIEVTPAGSMWITSDTGDIYQQQTDGTYQRVWKAPRFIGQVQSRPYRMNNVLDVDLLNIYSNRVQNGFLSDPVNISATLASPRAHEDLFSFFSEDATAGDGGSPLAGQVDMMIDDSVTGMRPDFDIPVSGVGATDRIFVAVKADYSPTQNIDDSMSAEDNGYTVWNVVRTGGNNADLTIAPLEVFGSTITNAPIPQITIDVLRGQYVHLALFVEKNTTTNTTVQFGGTDTSASSLRILGVDLRTQAGRLY